MSQRHLVSLAERKRAALRCRLTAGRCRAREMLQAPVLLRADCEPDGPGWTNEAIAVALDVGSPTVKRVGKRFAEAGGLMAYVPNLHTLFCRSPTYVNRILNGTKAADLPLEQPTVFDFVINLQTAHTLGMTIPDSVLQQATELIQ